MGLFDKWFGGASKEEKAPPSAPMIRFGRYSDNNKSLAKTKRWFEAEDLFKAKKFNESIEAFFDYLRDEEADNVQLKKEGAFYSFEIYQGTKIVKGLINEQEITASVSLARMEKPSVPVMRRLLELNYSLYYSRYALQGDKLCMLFDTPKDTASPNKLYYGLKEIATKADKQDDLLITDFNTLQAVDDSHVTFFPEQETETKYRYFQHWIQSTLKRVEELNQDSFSGGIAYLLLTLLYRIDYLITPEGKLLNEIERINNLYWSNKEEKTSVERNQILKDAFHKLLAWPKEEVVKYFYRSRASFAITMPKPHSAIADSIHSANENMYWYRDNNYADIAIAVMEYGLAYAQYSYSLPKPLSDFFDMMMEINNPIFYADLGATHHLLQNDRPSADRITQRIEEIIRPFSDKYPKLQLDTSKLNFSSILEFQLSFLTEIENLNFDSPPHQTA